MAATPPHTPGFHGGGGHRFGHGHRHHRHHGPGHPPQLQSQGEQPAERVPRPATGVPAPRRPAVAGLRGLLGRGGSVVRGSAAKASLSQSWICDGCGGRNLNSRWRCGICPDYDLCGPCLQQRKHPVHVRHMKPLLPSTNYVCDNCGKENSPDRWRCVVCSDFDFCGDCYRSHRHCHRLEHIPIEHTDGWLCDICGFTKDSGRYRCAHCRDFDCCADCKTTLNHPHPLYLLTSDLPNPLRRDLPLTSPPPQPPPRSSTVPTTTPTLTTAAASPSSSDSLLPPVPTPIPLDLSSSTPNFKPISTSSETISLASLSASLPVSGLGSLSDSDSEDDDEKQECVICMAMPKNAVFVHGELGHQACCLDCAKDLFKAGQPCPICRAPIEKVIKNIIC